MTKHTAETWRLAQGVSYYYQELLRRPGDARTREQYEWARDRYVAAVEKEKEQTA
jgi:hypothetical protein